VQGVLLKKLLVQEETRRDEEERSAECKELKASSRTAVQAGRQAERTRE